MRTLILLLFLSFLSCDTNKENHIKNKISFLKKMDIGLFQDIGIKARVERNGKYIAYRFFKNIDGKNYTFPNFNYHEWASLNDTIKNQLIEFANIYGIFDREEAENFIKNYSNNVIKAFEKTAMVEIRGDLEIGCICIIFYINKDNYIAYVNDFSAISNKHWKTEINQALQIEKSWYFRVSPPDGDE